VVHRLASEDNIQVNQQRGHCTMPHSCMSKSVSKESISAPSPTSCLPYHAMPQKENATNPERNWARWVGWAPAAPADPRLRSLQGCIETHPCASRSSPFQRYQYAMGFQRSGPLPPPPSPPPSVHKRALQSTTKNTCCMKREDPHNQQERCCHIQDSKQARVSASL